MKVLKFGGTSVGTPQSLRNVKMVVEGLNEPAIVVVSALGGVTDLLIKAAGSAAAGDTDVCEATLKQIEARHSDVIDALVPPERHADVEQLAQTLLDDLRATLAQVREAKSLEPPMQCRVVSFGEALSSMIISHVIDGAEYCDSFRFIKTRRSADGHNEADLELCNRFVADQFSAFHARVGVAPGFVATDADSGEITNLGRGGSDFTAAIVAAALNASCLEIWTDVDGFMTADPRTHADARVMPHMTYAKASQMCRDGAKVIYFPTISPVEKKGIPLWVKNTFNPTAPGTLIDGNED